jgi:hypothetical protein
MLCRLDLHRELAQSAEALPGSKSYKIANHKPHRCTAQIDVRMTHPYMHVHAACAGGRLACNLRGLVSSCDVNTGHIASGIERLHCRMQVHNLSHT